MNDTNFDIGVSLDTPRAPVLLPSGVMTKHMAFLGGTGSGKTTAAMNVVEQAVMAGIDVIMIDRKGDLCGYGGMPDLPPSKRAPWENFFSQVEPVIYTPGHPGGRNLQIRLVPEGMDEMDVVDRENAINMAAHALADMLGYKDKGADGQRRAIIFQAMRLMALSKLDIGIHTLTAYLSSPSERLLSTVAFLDLSLISKIVMDLAAFGLDKGRVLTQSGEPLTMDNLLGRGSKRGRARLSIISTKFLGNATMFFVAQLFIEAARWASKNPSDSLQAMIFVDEADVYMPAKGAAATREPLLNLLKRGRSAGLSVGLATQSPGDLDYRGRDNINTWFLGRIRELVALRKVEPMLGERPELMHELPTMDVGEFALVAGTQVIHLKSRPSMLQTTQLSEDQILALAHKGPPSMSDIVGRIRTRRAMEE